MRGRRRREGAWGRRGRRHAGPRKSSTRERRGGAYLLDEAIEETAHPEREEKGREMEKKKTRSERGREEVAFSRRRLAAPGPGLRGRPKYRSVQYQ